MAKLSGRDRMISSIEEITDRSCSEAVYVQQRPRWIFALFFGTLIAVVTFFIAIDGPPILMGAVAGGLPIGLSSLTISSYVLARVDDDVVLARSSRMWARAIIVEWQTRAPVDATWDRAVVSRTLTFAGQTFLISPLFVDRAKRILGSSTA